MEHFGSRLDHLEYFLIRINLFIMSHTPYCTLSALWNTFGTFWKVALIVSKCLRVSQCVPNYTTLYRHTKLNIYTPWWHILEHVSYALEQFWSFSNMGHSYCFNCLSGPQCTKPYLIIIHLDSRNTLFGRTIICKVSQSVQRCLDRMLIVCCLDFYRGFVCNSKLAGSLL